MLESLLSKREADGWQGFMKALFWRGFRAAERLSHSLSTKAIAENRTRDTGSQKRFAETHSPRSRYSPRIMGDEANTAGLREGHICISLAEPEEHAAFLCSVDLKCPVVPAPGEHRSRDCISATI
jgi:hypothetical protein